MARYDEFDETQDGQWPDAGGGGGFDDEWGSSPQSDEGGGFDDEWGDSGGGGSDDEWGDQGGGGWGSDEDEFAPQEEPQQQGGFISQDDDGWGNTSGVDETSMMPADQDSFVDSKVDLQGYKPKQVKFGMKTVAFIILGLCVVVAVVFLSLDKIHLTPKPSGSNTGQQTQQQQPVGDQGQGGGQQQGGGGYTSPDVSSVTMVQIPETMRLDYSGDILTANGQIHNKLKYVQGHQVLYCLNIVVAFGNATQTVSFYCSYSAFNQVKEGDIVVITYQQVNENYISVHTVEK